MKTLHDKILEAIKKGVPIRHIAKHAGVTERTLWNRIKKDKEYKVAYNYHLTVVDNIFN